MESEMIETKDLSFSQKEDPYESSKPIFHKPIYESALEAFHHSSEMDFMDISKIRDHTPIKFGGDPDLEPKFSQDMYTSMMSPIPRSVMNLSASPNIFFAGNNNGFSQYHHNMNSKLSQESFGATAFRKLHNGNPLDDYYVQFESNADNSNNNTMKGFQDPADNSTGFQMHYLWGNDPSKTPKPKQLSEVPDFLPKTMSFAPTFNNYEENEEEAGGFHYQIGGGSSQKVKQEPEAKKPIAVKIEAKNTEAKTIATPPNANKLKQEDDYLLTKSATKTPTNKRRTEDLKTTCKSTPISKVEMSGDKRGGMFDDEDEDNEDGADKQRSSRGLRVLSVKVRDIVLEKQETSYKEVADCLIEEFNLKYRVKKPGEAKDEQNVKRRVYDALNVLIAADILIKQGKTVLCDETLANLGPVRRQKLKDDKANLEQKIHEIKKRNKSKVDIIQDLVAKFAAIKSLKERNKSRIIVDGTIGSEENTQPTSVIDVKNETAEEKENIMMTPQKGKKKGTPAGKSNNKKGKKVKIEENSESQGETMEDELAPVRIYQDEVIKFPFFGLTYSTEFNQMNLKTNDSKTRLSIESKNPLTVYGDIDLVMKMKSNPITKRFFEESIPTEVHKYISKTYKENLV